MNFKIKFLVKDLGKTYQETFDMPFIPQKGMLVDMRNNAKNMSGHLRDTWYDLFTVDSVTIYPGEETIDVLLNEKES